MSDEFDYLNARIDALENELNRVLNEMQDDWRESYKVLGDAVTSIGEVLRSGIQTEETATEYADVLLNIPESIKEDDGVVFADAGIYLYGFGAKPLAKFAGRTEVTYKLGVYRFKADPNKVDPGSFASIDIKGIDEDGFQVLSDIIMQGDVGLGQSVMFTTTETIVDERLEEVEHYTFVEG